MNSENATETESENLTPESQSELLQTIHDQLVALTEAVRTVGMQQQWVTDTVAQVKAEVDHLFTSGNPIKALMHGLIGGKRNG